MRILVALVAVLAVPATASAATIEVDGSTGADSPTCGAAGSPCQTIGQGVENAAGGDTVQVAPGTYNESQVDIDKAISVAGAGADQTTLDGGQASDFTRNGTLRLSAPTGDASVSGLTVTGIGSPAVGGTPTGIVVEPDGNTGGPSYTISNVRVTGNGAGGSDYGFWCENNNADVVIEGSEIANNDFNPLLWENCTGSLDLRDNTIEKTAGTAPSSAFFAMVYQGREVTAPQRIRDNDITGSGVSFNGAFIGPDVDNPDGEGTYSDVAITGNTISSGGTAVSLNNLAGTGSDGTISDAVITHNTLTGAGGGDGIRLHGAVPGTTIDSNTVLGFGNGLHVRGAGSGEPSGTTALANRIAGNGTGARNTAGAGVSAENNWWGCNAGPGGAGCAPNVGSVDADPWLVMSIAASKSEVALNEASEISVDLLQNSAGETAPGAFPEGGEVAFGSNIGTVNPATDALAARQAGTTFSSAQSGNANVSATFDGQTVSVPIRVLSPCKLINLNIKLLEPFGLPPINICL
ncbi:MAG: hypothetical protein WD844_02890 [Thermoleophilaceae bacterium]